MKNIYLILGLFFVICCLPTMGLAQNQDVRLEAKVTQLAGGNIYLNIGRNDGVNSNDTLDVYQNGNLLGQLLVRRVARKFSITGPFGTVFPVTRGMQFQVVILSAPTTENLDENTASSDNVTDLPQDETTETVGQSTLLSQRQANQSKKRGIDISGRLMVNTTTVLSRTESVFRTKVNDKIFVIPSANLNLRIRNIPGGFSINTNIRTDFRYDQNAQVGKGLQFRAYRFSVEKNFKNVQITAGRFYNAHVRYSGYWDGVQIHYGNRKTGFGISGGFMPDRGNIGLSTEMPRFGVFTHYGKKLSQFRYDVSASYDEVRPTTELPTHRYAGVSQNFKLGDYTLTQDVQVDQNPISDAWTVTRLNLRARYQAGSNFGAYARFSLRQPYRIYSANPISYQRNRYTLGLNGSAGRLYLGGDVNLYKTTGSYDSQSAGIWMRLAAQKKGTGFNGSFTYRSSDRDHGFFARAGADRTFGKVTVRLDYSFYQNKIDTGYSLPNASQNHRLGTTIMFPITRRLHLHTRANIQYGTYLQSASFYTSLRIQI